VRSIDLVTPDGRLGHVTPASEPDLFWALRGGGGGFGVVTGMEVDLVPVTRLYGGGLFFDVAQAPDVLDGWYRWTRSVPDEMTSALTMLPYPDIPAIPERLRRRHIAQIQVSHLGSTEEGRRLVEPLRSLGPCVRDTLRELPYAESGEIFDEPDQPHAYRSQNRLLRDLDARALAQLTRTTDQSAPVMCVVGIRHLGGALARPPRVANAVGHRDAAYSLTVLSPTEPGQEEYVRAQHEAALAPFAPYEVGRYLNFSHGPLDEQAVRSAFDDQTWDRLAALRSRYDPHGLLRPHHPLPTAGTD
jgi:FAD/FMN-containing dehydrogenase